MTRRRIVTPEQRTHGGVLNGPVEIKRPVLHAPSINRQTSWSWGLVQLRTKRPTVLPELELQDGVPERCPTGPCPYYQCRYHLWRVDEEDRSGRYGADTAIKRTGPDTCALEVADRGPQSTEEIGRLLGVDRRAAEIVVRNAVQALAAAMRKAKP